MKEFDKQNKIPTDWFGTGFAVDKFKARLEHPEIKRIAKEYRRPTGVSPTDIDKDGN